MGTAKGFRESASLACLVIIALACLVYLVLLLSSILQSLLWAFFIVMTVTPLSRRIERILRCIGRCCSSLCSPLCGPRRTGSNGRVVEFASIADSSAVSDRTALTSSTNRAIGMSDEEAGLQHQVRHRSVSAGEPPVAQVPHSSESSDSLSTIEDDNNRGVNSPSEFNWVRSIATLLALFVMVSLLLLMVAVIINSAIEVQQHFKDQGPFKKGVERLGSQIQSVTRTIAGVLPQGMVKDLTNNALSTAENLIQQTITGIVAHTGQFLFDTIMTLLFAGFWISAPFPLDRQTEELFQRYLALKALVCLGYGVSIGALMHFLDVDLAVLIGMLSGVFSFIPEVGALLGLFLPVPVILLDGRLESPWGTLFAATLGQMGLKFLFGNLIEVKLIESDRLLHLHPLVLVVSVAVFATLMGPHGALLSVPLTVYVKFAAMSSSVPENISDRIITFLEGDPTAPARHRETRKTVYMQAKIEARQERE